MSVIPSGGGRGGRRRIGLTMVDIAEGQIATPEQIGVPPHLVTPLTSLMILDVQTQCASLIQNQARACVLGVHHVSLRDMRHRSKLSMVAQRLVVQKWASKPVRPYINAFQSTVATTWERDGGDSDLSRFQLTVAGERLKHATRVKALPNPYAAESLPAVSWYFKLDDGTKITQKQAEATAEAIKKTQA